VGALLDLETSFRLRADGAGGAAGATGAGVAAAEHRTAMDWEAEVIIGGPIGKMGETVLRPVVDRQVVAVLAALERQVAEAKAER